MRATRVAHPAAGGEALSRGSSSNRRRGEVALWASTVECAHYAVKGRWDGDGRAICVHNVMKGDGTAMAGGSQRVMVVVVLMWVFALGVRAMLDETRAARPQPEAWPRDLYPRFSISLGLFRTLGVLPTRRQWIGREGVAHGFSL